MKNKYIGLAVFCLVLIGCLIVSACNKKTDYTIEIRQLDSLKQEMDASKTNLKSIQDVRNMADSSSAHLQFIQENYRAPMPQKMAEALNIYGLMRKDMASLTEFSQTLMNKMDTSQKQMVDLRQALSEGATHDANDNKLTEDYVKNALLKEKKNAEQLLRNVQLQKQKQDSIQNIFNQMQPQVKMWMDSLQVKAKN